MRMRYAKPPPLAKQDASHARRLEVVLDKGHVHVEEHLHHEEVRSRLAAAAATAAAGTWEPLRLAS